jgi:site-specific DNA-adenine methylase
MTKRKTKSALPYFGSDSEVASSLAGLLDHCRHVTIPFCGGLAILPHLKAKVVVANDKNWAAIHFYRVVNDPVLFPELLRKCQATLNHPLDGLQAHGCWNYLHQQPGTINEAPVMGAWAYWAMCWIGRKGRGGTRQQFDQMTTPSVRWTATGGANASRLRAAAEDLSLWAEHFRRCDFTSECFRVLLPKVADDPSCGIYCDPPWVGAGDEYLHPFTPEDHRDLAKQLYRFRETTVVLRYGDDPLIRELYADWRIIEASSRDQNNAVKGELWITNKGE